MGDWKKKHDKMYHYCGDGFKGVVITVKPRKFGINGIGYRRALTFCDFCGKERYDKL